MLPSLKLKLLFVTVFVVSGLGVLATGSTATKEILKVRMFIDNDNLPYYRYSNNTTNGADRGLISDMLQRGLINICGAKIQLGTQPNILKTNNDLVELITTKSTHDLLTKLNTSADTDEIVIVGASTYGKLNLINKAFRRVNVISTKPVLIVHSGELLLLVKFFRTFSKCLIVVFFAMMCCIILSALVWAIEHWSGSTSFPNSFGAGLWSSFWFSFVTMATVGYGDKVPKHPLSRVVSIVWILFGLMLVALITATVWSSINEDYTTNGRSIGVLSNSSEETVVTNHLHGTPVPYDTHAALIDALRKKEIESAVIDKNVAAYNFVQMEITDLKMEREIDVLMKVRLFVYYNATRIGCYENYKDSDWLEDEMNSLKIQHIPPREVTKFHVRSIMQTFNGMDDGILLSTTLTATCIVLLAITTELRSKIKLYLKNRRFQNDNSSPDFCSPTYKEEFEKSKEYEAVSEIKIHLDEIINCMREKAFNEYNEKRNPSISTKL